MDIFVRLATTSTLAIGLQLFTYSGQFMAAFSFYQSVDNIDVMAEYQPKDNGGPKRGEDAGTHSWRISQFSGDVV